MYHEADLVLRRGTVYTMRGELRHSALAVRDARIIAVGADDEIEALIGLRTRVVDLAGRTVLPGLCDVHTHVASNARDPENVECRDFFEDDLHSVADVLGRLSAAAANRGSEEWVVGIGGLLQELRMKERRLPTRAELDEAVGGRPCYVTFGPHLVVANTAALEIAGIGPDTADPQGGEIDRDATGRPTGVLREQAQHLVRSPRPPTGSDLADRIERELQDCARRGVTTIHEIVKSTDEVRAYQQLERQGRLPVRVHLVFRVFQSTFDTFALLNLGLRVGFGSDRLRFGGVKVSVDGGDDKRTGFYPREGDEARGFSPLLRMAQEDLDPIIERYHAQGIRICVHAVGDMALDMTLESFARALARHPRGDDRHRVEHMGNFMATPDRLARAGDLGLVPVPNPTSLYYVGEDAHHGLGPERVQDAFPFRRLLESGTPLVIASDGPGLWPVDPLRDIGTCVTRRVRSGAVLSPAQDISAAQALTAVTATAAWLGFVEDDLGTLEAGKLADLVVLGQDPLTCSPQAIASTPVELTMVGGEVTFQREE
jgi:predicted amidohydrolase YtcJ